MKVNLADIAWAKTNMRYKDDPSWLSVYHHSLDAYHAGNIVWDNYLNEPTKKLLSEAIGGEEAARSLVLFLTACHDIGKITPAFQGQAGGDRRARSERFFGTIPSWVKSSNLRHEVSSALSLEKFFSGTKLEQDIESLIAPVAGHHGVYGQSQRNDMLMGRLSDENYKSEGAWNDTRQELIKYFYDISGLGEHIDTITSGNINKTVQSIIGGFIVVSDWTASNEFYYPLTLNGVSNRVRRETRAEKLIDVSSPWNIKGIDRDDPDACFAQRFSLPDGSRMRPVQRLIYDNVKYIDEPHLIIVEAPMGVGKTEAALFAAEAIAEQGNYGGVMFAMPTMATTNGIFPRVAQWLENSTTGSESITLKHSKAHLNEDFSSLHGSNIHGNSVSVSGFFSGKKSVLSPFLVSTIDNILLASLIQKHFSLRHLGLAGKIVIIDEVHAADAYMRVYLKRSLEWLRSMGCTVIILSATLPESTRTDLISTYLPKPKKKGRRRRETESNKELTKDTRYPLVTLASRSGTVRSVTCEDDTMNSDVSLKLQPGLSMEDILRVLHEREGNAAVIVNTVKKAQDLYDLAIDSGEYGKDEVVLFHSRFIATDRLQRESELLDRLGKNTDDRPRRMLVIATQVIEQSLDLDFDVMVSEIAPIDLLLQRMGRLHRHNREYRPEGFSTPQFIVSGFDHKEDTVVFNKGSEFIYSRALLLRTFNVISGLDKITIPEDIPELIYEVYTSTDLNEEEKMWMDERERKEKDKSDKALGYLLKSPESKGDSLLGSNDIPFIESSRQDDIAASAAVRDSQDSLEVIVLQEIDGGISLVGDDQLINEHVLPTSEMIKRILGNTVSLPMNLTVGKKLHDTMEVLESEGYIPAWQDDHRLRGELIMILDEDSSYWFKDDVLVYDQDKGVIIYKRGDR